MLQSIQSFPFGHIKRSIWLVQAQSYDKSFPPESTLRLPPDSVEGEHTASEFDLRLVKG